MKRIEQVKRNIARPLAEFWRIGMLRKNRATSWTPTMVCRYLVVCAIAMFATIGSYASSSVPPVVLSSNSTVPSTGLASNPNGIALDACGNLYTVHGYGGDVWETPAGGGAAKKIYAGTGANWSGNEYIQFDAAKANLYFAEGYGGNGSVFYKIPMTGCVANATSVVALSDDNGGYFFGPLGMAADASGDLFLAQVYYPSGGTAYAIEEIVQGKTSTSTVQLLGGASLPSAVAGIALDSQNNLYYAEGNAVYELAYSSGAYSATPVQISTGYTTIESIFTDGAGDLYVLDIGNLLVIPNETSGSTAALNPTDQYIVATGLPNNLPGPPTTDGSGNFYYVNWNAPFNEISLGKANFGTVASGSNSSLTLNAVFNTSVSPASIATGSTAFAVGTQGSCAAGTSYSATNACTVSVQMAPTSPGANSTQLFFKNASGSVLGEAYLTGTGTAAGLTMDPGTVSSIGSGYSAPKSVAGDNLGNVFIADSAANTVWEVVAGGSTAASIGSGLNSPQGVAVDSVGNIFVADSGNNRIVEIPVVNGTPSTASQSVLISDSALLAGQTLSAPEGIAIDGFGNLYVADTGNKRVVYLPNVEGWTAGLAQSLGSNLSAPSAVSLDTAGNVYVADADSGKVYELELPLSSGVQVTVASGYSNPSGIAIDASGALFVVDQGSQQVLRVPYISGTLVATQAVNVAGQQDAAGNPVIAAPFGVSLDSNGNVYLTDSANAKAYSVARTAASLSAGKNAPGSVSNTLTVTAVNSGNSALTFGTPYLAASGDTSQFSLLSSESGACASGDSLAVGEDCFVEAEFTPGADGSFTLDLALSSNAVNGLNHTVAFTGQGWPTVATTTTVTQSSPSGTLTYDEAATFGVTVSSSQGTPIGNISLVVDGVTKQTAALSSGVAKFTLPAGALSGGSHTIGAVYSGADAPTVTYAGSTASITIAVAAVSTITTLSYTILNQSPASQPAQTPMTLTATVSSAYAGIPTGVVTFTITDSGGNSTSGTGTLTGGTEGYQATYSYIPVAPAAGVAYDLVSIKATYPGDVNFNASSSTSGTFDVAGPQGSIAVTSSSLSVSASAQKSGSVTFTASSYGGWTGAVGFSCDPSTLPAFTSCVFSPGQVSVLPNTSTVTNAPATVAMSFVVNQPTIPPTAGGMIWWVAGASGLLLLFARRRLKLAVRTTGWNLVLLIAAIGALSAGMLGVTACSGTSFTTPKGTSTVTVYAAADPYKSGSTTNTVACSTINTYPCAQQVFKVNVTVQ